MIAGILKAIKIEENRVSMTPAGVEVLKDHGHTLLVEKGANVIRGQVTFRGVADAFGLKRTDIEKLL